MKLATILSVLALTAAASGATGQGMLAPLTEIHGRIVIEPSYPATFPEGIRLTFTDAEGTTVDDAMVSESVKTTNFSATRGGMTGEARLWKDGTFLILLPKGRSNQFRLIVRLPGAKSKLAERYFVKSVQSGEVNLLEKLLQVTTPFAGEIVITLGKCVDDTPAECK